MTQPVTKYSRLRAMMDAGDWTGALRLANSFGQLGAHAKPIRQAWAAQTRPEFYRQLKQDPAALVAAGIEALKARYDR